MTYPTSSPVAAGQPTAAAQYNNLRLDALYCGAESSAAAPLGQMLGAYHHNLSLSPLGTNRLRLNASPETPAALMIDGIPCRASANVDLASGAVPSGTAALWYVFAAAAVGGAITLTVNTSPTPAAGQRLIGSFWWDGSAILAGSISTLRRADLLDALGQAPAALCGGRLTLQSGVPYEQGARSGNTLYFSPYASSTVALYFPGFGWRSLGFSEVSLAIPATANKVYDIYAAWDGSAFSLSAVVWTSLTARASSPQPKDGRWVHPSDECRLYLGTVRTGSTGTVEDSPKQRWVWNAFNRQPKLLYHNDDTDHTYASGTWRYWNNDSSAYVSALCGIESPLSLTLQVVCDPATASYTTWFGIGEDSATPNQKTEISYNEANYTRLVTVLNNLFGPGSRNFTICEMTHASNAADFKDATLSGIMQC